jgi:hypothetical protein
MMRGITPQECPLPPKRSSRVPGKEPSDKEIQDYMREHNENYYNSRERLREKAYGGKPPEGFQSWGDYWKSY